MISVIIPLYNKEAIIAQTLRSVLSQSYDDFEVVVVNDGSTDCSVDILQSIGDSRIRLINQENGGPSAARNTGIKNAKGDWLVFLDADDELLPGALTFLWDGVKNNPTSNFICAPFYIGSTEKENLACNYQDAYIKNPYRGHICGYLLTRTGAFICKKQLCASNLFDERIRRFEDLEWLLRIYKQAKIYTISEPVLKTNIDFAEASRARKNVEEDFLGHLDFENKGFGERMALYKLFIEERERYLEQTRKLYPNLYRRYDYYIIYQLIGLLKRLELVSHNWFWK